jgi:hypothetical protein
MDIGGNKPQVFFPQVFGYRKKESFHPPHHAGPMAPGDLVEAAREGVAAPQHVDPLIASRSKSISFDAEDIVAFGALVLCIAGGAVALVIAVALAFRAVNGSVATKIILGCVGGSAVGSIVAKLSVGKKKKKAN